MAEVENALYLEWDGLIENFVVWILLISVVSTDAEGDRKLTTTRGRMEGNDSVTGGVGLLVVYKLVRGQGSLSG
jgi:hypothetical protein